VRVDEGHIDGAHEFLDQYNAIHPLPEFAIFLDGCWAEIGEDGSRLDVQANCLKTRVMALQMSLPKKNARKLDSDVLPILPPPGHKFRLPSNLSRGDKFVTHITPQILHGFHFTTGIVGHIFLTFAPLASFSSTFLGKITNSICSDNF
jgi:hypothetical protein